jgi:phosphate:Na+ symporter
MHVRGQPHTRRGRAPALPAARLAPLGAAAALAGGLPVLAAAAGGVAVDGVSWGTMGMSLFGGLALFLFGMEQMADALKAVAGERMRDILARLTTNRFTGAISGAIVTGIIQSSSVTTVLLVGFITAGLMSFSQSIGVIMGANIGSTFTAQLIAFKVTKAALLMIGAGFSMLFVSRQERIRHYGAILMGMGMIFFGMSVMSDAMDPLRSYPPFLDVMVHLENPLLAILVAAGFTALIQSSAATTGIVIVMASQGFVTLPAGIALAFGANIGTCVTAMLAAIGKPREAVRAAIVHVLFNVAGVVIWVGLIDQLAQFVRWISPAYPELSGMDRIAAAAPRQIANAHTIFNVANTLIFIGLTSQLARLVEWLVPDRPLDEEGMVVRPRYLDAELLSTPSLALDRVRLEVEHMGERIDEMLRLILPAIFSGTRTELRRIARMDDEVDTLHAHTIEYLGKVSKQALTEIQTQRLIRLMEVVNDLENIGDVIETNLVVLGEERLDHGIRISQGTRDVLRRFHEQVIESVHAAVHSVAQNDEEQARAVIAMKRTIGELTDSASLHQAKRLVAEEPNRVAAYTLEIDIIERFRRIYYFAKRMAKSVVAEEAEEEVPAA